MRAQAAWRGGGRRLTTAPIELSDILEAQARIAGMAQRTPMKASFGLRERLGTPVFLKLETLQPTGAFKLRGAANHLLSLSESERRRGVITVSTGNHGRAVAYVAQALSIRCVVCLSSLVPSNKINSIRAVGAELDVGGINQDAAFERALARAAAEGLILVNPFDDPKIIAGQGTIALEILDDLPHVGTIVMPISGGGLAAGIAIAAKAQRPAVRIIAVASDRSLAMLDSLLAGRPIEAPEHSSLADALGGGIGLDNRYSFGLVRDLVDEIHVVDDEEIAEALRFVFGDARLFVEGAAAASIAALLRAGEGDFPGPVVAVMTGDNIEPGTLVEILSEKAPGPARRSASIGETR